MSRRIVLTKRLSGHVKGEQSNDESNVQVVEKSGAYVECVQDLGRKPTTAIR